MSRREDRERKLAGWLEHLQSWKISGEALSAYARGQGVEPWSMYYWRKVLRREGRWPQESGEVEGGRRPAAVSGLTGSSMRFARVTFEEATRQSPPITIRVSLSSGRRVEIELEDIRRLGEVLMALESAA